MQPRRETVDRLRHEIDQGQASDKVAGIDPAAAPLGTDAEAAGVPPSDAEIRMARDAEIRQPPQHGAANPMVPDASARSRPQTLYWIVAVAAVVVALAAITAFV